MQKAVIYNYDLIDSKEICRICDFSEIHLNRLLKDKKIPAVKIHRTWVFSRKDIELYQEDRLQRSKSDKRVMRED